MQDVEIIESASYGKMLLPDGLIQSAEDDEHLYHEALVHPGMIAHPEPREVLIIGGGKGATLREVLRHRSVRRATMVDIDSELIAMCKEHLDEWHQGAFDDPRAELVIGDGRAFIRDPDRRVDVVIIDITDFLDHGPALFLYTREFYELVAARLAPGGIVIVQGLEMAVSDWEEHATLRRTLEAVFSIVRTYQTFVSSFIFTWGFLTASNVLDPSALSEADVDEAVADRIDGELRSYDGITHRGYFALPKDLRVLLTQPGPILTDADAEAAAFAEPDEASVDLGAAITALA